MRLRKALNELTDAARGVVAALGKAEAAMPMLDSGKRARLELSAALAQLNAVGEDAPSPVPDK